MPEIAAIGFVGAIATFIAVNLNLYWSLEQGRVLEMEPQQSQKSLQEKDYQKETRSAFLFGTMMIFLNWLGLFFFLLYFISIKIKSVLFFRKWKAWDNENG